MLLTKIIILVITFLILGTLQFIFPVSKPKYKDIGKKNCTQHQPFRTGKITYIICNFICDGNCQYKGTKYFKTLQNNCL